MRLTIFWGICLFVCILSTIFSVAEDFQGGGTDTTINNGIKQGNLPPTTVEGITVINQAGLVTSAVVSSGTVQANSKSVKMSQVDSLETSVAEVSGGEGVEISAGGAFVQQADVVSLAGKKDDLLVMNAHAASVKSGVIEFSSASFVNLPQFGLSLADVDHGYVKSNSNGKKITASFTSEDGGDYKFSNPLASCDTTGLVDSDDDGLSDRFELMNGLIENDADSDGDGFSDDKEVMTYGSDPRMINSEIIVPDEIVSLLGIGQYPWLDRDGDGLSDVVEYALGSSHRRYDSDGDGLGDGYELPAGLPLLNKTEILHSGKRDCEVTIIMQPGGSAVLEFAQDIFSAQLENGTFEIGTGGDKFIVVKPDHGAVISATIMKDGSEYQIVSEQSVVEYHSGAAIHSVQNGRIAIVDESLGFVSAILGNPGLYTYDYSTRPEFYAPGVVSIYQVLLPKESWTRSFQIQNPRGAPEQVLHFVMEEKVTGSFVDIKQHQIRLLGKLKYLRIGYEAGAPFNEFITVGKTDGLYHVVYEGLQDGSIGEISLDDNDIAVSLNITGDFTAGFDDVRVEERDGMQKAFWNEVAGPPALILVESRMNPVIRRMGNLVTQENIVLYSRLDRSKDKLAERVQIAGKQLPYCGSQYLVEYNLEPHDYAQTVILLENRQSHIDLKNYLYLR